MRLTFTIQRFNPEVDSTPHPQEIRLDVGRGMTVLDALIRIKQECDGSLALRYSCRSAICGSCAMTINGSEQLACRTSLRKELERYGHIAVAPLRKAGATAIQVDSGVTQPPFELLEEGGQGAPKVEVLP